MKGRFTGLTDEQWQVLEPFLPTKRRRVGRPN
ncbi:MAG: putative transposase of family, partial [Chlamydiales bacterium]|nr:putative transposase of family [Chlamydiales bacterium]